MIDENAKDSGFYKLLTETYKLKISDEDYHRLTTVLNHYNIEPGKTRIMLEDSVESFIANLHLIRNIKCTRTCTLIDIDELLFILHPVTYGFTELININVPVKVNKKIEVNDPEILKMPQNIAVIRSLVIAARDSSDVKENYTILVYNDELNVVAGIRFEKI